MKKVIKVTFAILLLFAILLILFPYLRYLLLINKFPINSAGIIFIDEVNTIPNVYWKYLDKTSFKFSTRKAPSANDVEIYRVQDKDTVMFLDFNPGDSCGIKIIDKITNPDDIVFDQNLNTYKDNSQTFLATACPE